MPHALAPEGSLSADAERLVTTRGRVEFGLRDLDHGHVVVLDRLQARLP